MRFRFFWLSLVALALGTAGCGGFVARRIAQAPNTYPQWFAPPARVTLAFDPKLLTNVPAQFVEAGPPPARIRYRVVEPADYQFAMSATNWFKHSQRQFQFDFQASLPGRPNPWTPAPRGTVVLLHGWGVGQFAMLPWALRLAQDGWRCVLVDLRGHGKSTGKRIYFGIRETHDLTQLLDTLEHDGRLAAPVDVLGESYGASLGLRWQTLEPRVQTVVAIAPYAGLSNAVLNISKDYAPCMPKWLLRSGIAHLPSLLNVPAAELDTTTVLSRHPVTALFIAGTEDRVAPPADVRRLHELASPDSKLIVVPDATHEAVTYFFPELLPPVSEWLTRNRDLFKP